MLRIKYLDEGFQEVFRELDARGEGLILTGMDIDETIIF